MQLDVSHGHVKNIWFSRHKPAEKCPDDSVSGFMLTNVENNHVHLPTSPP